MIVVSECTVPGASDDSLQHIFFGYLGCLEVFGCGVVYIEGLGEIGVAVGHEHKATGGVAESGKAAVGTAHHTHLVA